MIKFNFYIKIYHFHLSVISLQTTNSQQIYYDFPPNVRKCFKYCLHSSIYKSMYLKLYIKYIKTKDNTVEHLQSELSHLDAENCFIIHTALEFFFE